MFWPFGGSLIFTTAGGYDCSERPDGYYLSSCNSHREPQLMLLKKFIKTRQNSRDKFSVMGTSTPSMLCLYYGTRLSCNSGMVPLLLSFLCKILWSPFTYSYLNFASQILSLFLPNPWILQQSINGKSALPVAVIGQKRQRELWRTKLKWWCHRKLEKQRRIEAGILWLFTASIGSFPNALRRQGWHGDDRHRTSFRSVPTLADGVAGNRNKIRVGFAGRIDPVIFVTRMVWKWPASHDLSIGTNLGRRRGRKWKRNSGRVRRYLW